MRTENCNDTVKTYRILSDLLLIVFTTGVTRVERGNSVTPMHTSKLDLTKPAIFSMLYRSLRAERAKFSRSDNVCLESPTQGGIQ